MRRNGKPTLIEVAERAGVHFATASRALDPTKAHLVSAQTREKVEGAALDIGYSANLAARGLRTGQTKIVGFAVADLSNPFLAPILRGAEAVLDKEGFWVVIAETQDDPTKFRDVIDRLLTRNVDGLIISSARYSDADFVREVAQRIPLTLAIRDLGTRDFFSVTHDDVLGGELAANHLADLGHIVLAEIRGSNNISSFKGRSEGFRRAVKARGLTNATLPRQTWLPTVEGGYQATRKLLESGVTPTGVFAHNDLMAVGALEALEEVGMKCPRDVSIVGYNDSPLTEKLEPSLTTVRLPGGRVGELAAEYLLAQMKDPDATPVLDRLAPQLVVRKSSRKPPPQEERPTKTRERERN